MNQSIQSLLLNYFLHNNDVDRPKIPLANFLFINAYIFSMKLKPGDETDQSKKKSFRFVKKRVFCITEQSKTSKTKLYLMKLLKKF